MTEAQAIERGFTVPVIADCGFAALELLVLPDADYDDQFMAFERLTGEQLIINGWLFVIEEEL